MNVWNIPKLFMLLRSLPYSVTHMPRGRTTDAVIERIVRDSPGVSLYWLKRRTRWNIGKVDGSVRRLVNAGKLFLVSDERNGRRLTLVYPSEFRPSTTVTVPSGVLQTSNPTWINKAHVYALDHHTIGIAGEPLQQWRKIARFTSKVRVKRDLNGVHLTIPKKFEEFYHLKTHYFTKTVNANNILITVGGQLVQSKSYPS